MDIVKFIVVTVVFSKKFTKLKAMKTFWESITICNLVVEENEYPNFS